MWIYLSLIIVGNSLFDHFHVFWHFPLHTEKILMLCYLFYLIWYQLCYSVGLNLLKKLSFRMSKNQDGTKYVRKQPKLYYKHMKNLHEGGGEKALIQVPGKINAVCKTTGKRNCV